jgi:poly(hydroxyalkanoate) depolymerase family esterase
MPDLKSIWSRVATLSGSSSGASHGTGRFESAHKFAWRLRHAPWTIAAHTIRRPAGRRKCAPYVLCHGCKQTPEEFAQGTRVAALADRLGCLVLLPRQKDTANPFRCWNWFDSADVSGRGEAAIVAAMIRSVRRRYRVDRPRVMAVGMSAGGALVAALGVRHPEVVHAVAIHSGLACGAATSAFTAIGVMQRGPETDVEAIAVEAGRPPACCRCRPRSMGSGPRSARQRVALVRQFLR